MYVYFMQVVCAFILDTSPSMNQRSANGMTYLDSGKVAIENFIKVSLLTFSSIYSLWHMWVLSCSRPWFHPRHCSTNNLPQGCTLFHFLQTQLLNRVIDVSHVLGSFVNCVIQMRSRDATARTRPYSIHSQTLSLHIFSGYRCVAFFFSLVCLCIRIHYAFWYYGLQLRIPDIPVILITKVC